MFGQTRSQGQFRRKIKSLLGQLKETNYDPSVVFVHRRRRRAGNFDGGLNVLEGLAAEAGTYAELSLFGISVICILPQVV